MPCHAMPCHAMPCHAMPCHAMPCHAMAPSSWDLKGNRYIPSRSGLQNKEAGLEQEVAMIEEEDQGNSPDVTLIAEDITQQRANLFVDGILIMLFEQASAAEKPSRRNLVQSQQRPDQDTDKTRGLPSRIFRLLLGMYLSTTTSSAPSLIMPEALHRHADSLVFGYSL
jgi:hypothetical protein